MRDALKAINGLALDTGRGMNSVVKVVVTLFDEDKIDIDVAKIIIEACKDGMHWCDGNEHEEHSVKMEDVYNRIVGTQNSLVTDLLYPKCFEELATSTDKTHKIFYWEGAGIICSSFLHI